MSRSLLPDGAPALAVVAHDLRFAWPDGRVLLDGVTVTFEPGCTGLLGTNGSGKSTLLRLLAGELTPDTGGVAVPAPPAVLPQDLPLRAGETVSDLLGIRTRRDALAAIENGTAGDRDWETLGDDWDVEERALARLARLGLPADLDRDVTGLSGGEAMLTALAGLLVDRPAVTLLDEPTNNLDGHARARLYDALADWPGVLVVVSHDRDLLDRVDRTAELRDGKVRVVDGPYGAYVRLVEAEQEAAARDVRVAEEDLRRERRQLAEAQVKLARRKRYADTDFVNKRKPKIVMNGRKREAQVAAGKYRNLHEDRVGDARRTLAGAEDRVRDDARIRIELPGTAVPAGRTVLDLPADRLAVRGPERIALAGPNGAGKTTLLTAIAAGGPGVVRGPDPVGYLPQRRVLDDPARSVLDTVRAAAPAADPQDVRAGLARFLLAGDDVARPAGTLSGGELFRLHLACLLLADPPPRLLLLDEPANDLDLESVAALVDAMRAYRGALLVVSHDEWLLADLGVERRWTVTGGRTPHATEP